MTTVVRAIQFLAMRKSFKVYDVEPPPLLKIIFVGLSCLEMVREARWDTIFAEK
jgi:hypothetical protein